MAGHSSAGWRDLQRRLSRHRRVIAALLAAAAILLATSAAHPRTAPTTAVWVAARDLAGGAALKPGDVRAVGFASSQVPAHALLPAHSVVGRFLAAPVRRGEPLTDERLLSPALLAANGTPDDLAVPIRVTDGAATSALVQAGDRVDVLAGSDPSTAAAGPTGPVVQDIRVLAVAGGDANSGSDGAGLVIVEVTGTQAAALAELPSGDQVSLALRRSS